MDRTIPGGIRLSAGATLPRPWVWALCLWIAGASFGQDLEIKSYGPAAGFPAAEVLDVGQDADGCLWLAGSFGLLRYDGLDVQEMLLDDSLESGQVALGWDADGHLWTLAARTPCAVLHHHGLHHGRKVDDPEVLPLPAPYSQGTMPTGFEVVGGDPADVALATMDGLWMWRRPDWRRLTVVDGLPDDRIHDIAEWGGRLVTAGPAGLAVIRAGFVDRSLDARLALAPSRDVRALAVSRLGGGESLWLVGDSWIGLLTESELQLLAEGIDWSLEDPEEENPEEESPPVLRAAADHQGGLYVGHGRTIYHFHPNLGFEVWLEETPAGRIHRILVDREGLVWLAGSGGTARISSRSYLSYRAEGGLFDDRVTALLERRDGTVVLGHRGGLSFVVGREVRSVFVPAITATAAGDRLEPVADLAETADGRLWLALGSWGLGEWDGDLRRVESFRGVDGPIRHLAVDPVDGDLRVATDRSLAVMRGKRLVPLDGRLSPNGPSERDSELEITGVRAGAEGIWVLTASGLSFLDGESPSRDRHWGLEPGDAARPVDVAPPAGEDRSRIWLATSEGLYTAEPSGTLRPAPHQALRQPLRFVVRDDNRLWLGVENGALRFELDRPESSESLTLEHRLAGRRPGAGGVMRDTLGRVWIATDQGVSVFDRHYDRSSAEPPRLELVTVSAGERSWSLDEPQRLPPGTSRLGFRYRIVSLLDRDQVQVSTRLEGYEDSWSEPANPGDGLVRYFDLPPGEYRFQARAVGPAAEWGPVISSQWITIVGPFWRQTWFYGVLGMALLAGLLTLQTVVTQRRHSLLLEEEVEQRVAELQASEDRYRKTFKTIEDGVITTDEHGRVALMNPRAQELTGWSEPDAMGESIDRVLQLFQQGVGDQLGPELSLLSNELRDTIGPTQTAILESRVGRRRTVETAASPIVSRGVGFAGMVFTFRDISRKREIEAELARAHKLEAIGLLAGGIAHDFNNLLTVVMGSLSLVLEQEEMGKQQREVLSDAENALVRARDLTQQLLTFSRGGAPVREAASIKEVIEDSASFVLRGSKVLCCLDLPSDLHVVDIDAGQISQVLNNLLINAAQAMPDGGKVQVRGQNVDQVPQPLLPGSYVSIEVTDTGTGIPEHLMHRVFDPYFSTKQEGRGLGLASAYSIVKSHDGLLTVQSELGEGTTFTLYLPASKSTVTGPADSGATKRLEAGGRMLVMDDDPVVRRTTGVMLEKLGFEPEFAVDGHEAMSLYARHMEVGTPFRAVMMDLTVPGGMGGQEAIQYILQLDPEAVGIVYSGYSNDPVLANYREYGFQGRLSKPFRLQDLRAVLSEVLAGDGFSKGHSQN